MRAERTMIMSWVKVNGPKGREVFVSYDFTVPAGRTNEPFQVHRGGNTFLLLSKNLIIEARAKAYVPSNDEAHPFEVELWPASPPSPTSMPGAGMHP